MNKYELLYIIASPYTDDEIKQIQGTVEKLLTKQGGEVNRNESLGKIKLAYPIKKEKYGTYVLVHFETETENIQQINRILGLTDEVLRHMIVEMPTGAEDREYNITGYEPPLSPKGVSRREEEEKKSQKQTSKPKKSKSSKPKKKTDDTSKKSKQESKDKKDDEEDEKLTMEELDKRLDEILDSDLGSV